MEFFTIGLPAALTIEALLYCLAGVALGTFIGVLPGLGPLAAVSLLLPVTVYLDPLLALIMLAGIYYGAEYGGAIVSILLNMPGTPGNAITCLDGYPMAKRGEAGKALFTAAISSFIGGAIGILVLQFLAPSIVTVALSFGAAEYFAAIVFSLVAASTITDGSVAKGLAMLGAGILIGTIGTDPYTGVIRYSFGQFELMDGVTIALVALGLFAIGEVVMAIGVKRDGKIFAVKLRDMYPSRKDMKSLFWPSIRGSAWGSFFGALPGVGPAIATITSYATEKNIAKNPEEFGTGRIEGVAGPEAANNAAAQTAFIPMLSLGIPGSATTAVMLGALIMNGIIPGPRLIVNEPELFWGLVASFWIGNVLLLVLNLPLIGVWASILRIPYHLLFPGIIAIMCVGVYSIHNSSFEVLLVLLFGLIGYFGRLLALPLTPLLLGFLLGPMLEENLRRALILAGGDFGRIAVRPIAGSLLVLTVVCLIAVVGLGLMRKRSNARAEQAA
ncbi:tripartite tricarboxylate transporter permease [Pelagibacterium lacus]|uniref:Tripartite tricarboxylate transporter permease n=1 Tax=Pelagibacterium lacus TaxID=2282655 RepID=A0A369W745_9HYPH|nr:tripartite tricarboxylate transporter permease [Pelagibacterium lacus]RDE09675.1 tripartite tricarboxylate transporter permease [Pelagibacterium lacus]